MLTSNQHFSNSPAYLWVGDHNHLIEQVIIYLKTVLCNKHEYNNTCNQCRLIEDQQHHAIKWYTPNPSYTVDNIRDIQRTIAFTLDSTQRYFIIIQKADYLTPLCANRLLKSIEEPPQGYQFILLTERKDALLNTIRSRCIISHYASSSILPQHPLLNYFSNNPKKSNPLLFLKDLKANAPDEHASVELLDTLLQDLISQYKSMLAANNDQASNLATMISILTEHTSKPIMPGSSKLFWKNLFLHIN